MMKFPSKYHGHMALDSRDNPGEYGGSYCKTEIPAKEDPYWFINENDYSRPWFKWAELNCDFNKLPYVQWAKDNLNRPDYFIFVRGRNAVDIVDRLFQLSLEKYLKGREWVQFAAGGFMLRGMNQKRARFVAQEFILESWYWRVEAFHIQDETSQFTEAAI